MSIKCSKRSVYTLYSADWAIIIVYDAPCLRAARAAKGAGKITVAIKINRRLGLGQMFSEQGVGRRPRLQPLRKELFISDKIGSTDHVQERLNV